MPRRRSRRRSRRQQRRGGINRRFIRSGPIRLTGVSPRNSLATAASYVRVARFVITSLPVSGASTFSSLVDVMFNLYKSVIQSVSYYVGAYSMFKITPACLFRNSPLLAKDTSGIYTFPGHPVSIRDINFVFRNTTQISEHAGRWAVVFIPYREEHDDKNYIKVLQNLTFPETASMPHARIASATEDIRISFRMKDRTAYCARPRELTEAIGVVYIIWDNLRGTDTENQSAFTNTNFNCEIDITAGASPHVIFGPQHRVAFQATDFDIPAITNGKQIRAHTPTGIEMRDYETEIATDSLRVVAMQE